MSRPSANVRELGRPGQRILGVMEFGDHNGLPALAFHGIPGTRLMFRVTDQIAKSLGLRIIAADRPGFGRSTPQPSRTLRDWLPEVEAILEAYEIDRFSLIGVSGGAPFAVATAAEYGDRVQGMVLFGPVGPIHDLQNDIPLNRRERLIFLQAPPRGWLLRAGLIPMNTLFRIAPRLKYNLFLKLLPKPDAGIMNNAEIRTQVIDDVGESLKQGGEGMRSDMRIFSEPWNVNFDQIKARTVLWQGMIDNIVPVKAALRLGELIPNCTVHKLPGAGHFWVYDHIERVLSTLKELALDDGQAAPASEQE
ncbi:MAG: alpha/beta hydrolase [Pseudomonadota bacterium]